MSSIKFINRTNNLYCNVNSNISSSVNEVDYSSLNSIYETNSNNNAKIGSSVDNEWVKEIEDALNDMIKSSRESYRTNNIPKEVALKVKVPTGLVVADYYKNHDGTVNMRIVKTSICDSGTQYKLPESLERTIKEAIKKRKEMNLGGPYLESINYFLVKHKIELPKDMYIAESGNTLQVGGKYYHLKNKNNTSSGENSNKDENKSTTVNFKTAKAKKTKPKKVKYKHIKSGHKKIIDRAKRPRESVLEEAYITPPITGRMGAEMTANSDGEMILTPGVGIQLSVGDKQAHAAAPYGELGFGTWVFGVCGQSADIKLGLTGSTSSFMYDIHAGAQESLNFRTKVPGGYEGFKSAMGNNYKTNWSSNYPDKNVSGQTKIYTGIDLGYKHGTFTLKGGVEAGYKNSVYGKNKSSYNPLPEAGSIITTKPEPYITPKITFQWEDADALLNYYKVSFSIDKYGASFGVNFSF